MKTRLFCRLLAGLFACSFAAAEPLPPPLMLASSYEAGVDVSQYLISEKLDGVRGRWDGTQLRTRGGHIINAPTWFTAGWPAETMDGELWIARGHFDEVSGIVRASQPDDAAWRKVRFMVFDLPAANVPFAARVERMRELLAETNIAWLQAVEQFHLPDAAALDARLAEVVAAGGEGLMLHHRDALYRAGRSRELLKYKPYEDDEARVIAHLPGQGKYRGMLGALLVERDDGLRFRIGSGFSDAERAAPPPVGSLVTYRYNGLTPGGVPRFVRFLRVRDETPAAAPAE